MNSDQIIKIDANGKILGRLATNISVLLRGKDKPSFTYNKLNNQKVIVFNAKKIIVTGSKMKQKKYYHHSGYIGNLKTQTFEEIFSKNPSIVLYKAVKNMLPKNRLQQKWLNNLKIYNGEIND